MRLGTTVESFYRALKRWENSPGRGKCVSESRCVSARGLENRFLTEVSSLKLQSGTAIRAKGASQLALMLGARQDQAELVLRQT